MSKSTETNSSPIVNKIDQIVQDPNMSTSAKIRSLYESGMNRSQIALMLNKRYQHVRNVLITPIKKS
jgi:hypothetical protein